MPKFISDEEMAQIQPSESPKSKKIISDDDMKAMEASAPSELDSGARGAAQGVSFGFADEIAGGAEALWNKAKGDPTEFGKLYQQYRDESRKNFKTAEEANPKSYMAGQVAGAVAPALLTAGGSTGATIGSLAAQGAAQGLGSSEADLLEGDYAGAARDTAIGGGIGAATGVAGKALAAGASKVAPYVKSGLNKLAGGLEEGAEKLAVKATGATGSQAMKFQPNAGRELLDEGLVKFGDSSSGIAKRVGDRYAQAGESIGDSLNQLEQKGVTGSVDNIVANLEQQVAELEQVPGNEKIVRQLKAQIDNLYERGESNIGINTAEQAKRNFQGQTNYFSDEAEKNATGRLASGFRSEVERAAQEADPAIAQKFIDEKRMSGLLNPIKEAAEKRAAQQAQAPFGGLTDVVVGSTTGPKGLAAKYAIQEAGKRAASSGAVISDNLANIVRTQPQKLGKFAKPLQEAAQRGAQNLAATHFVLQQTNPEYRQLVNTSEDDTDEQQAQ